MDMHALEKAKQQWQAAADSMPQLICLINSEGLLLHANLTMEWWGLGDVASAKGRELHEILHRGCTDEDCYFRQLWRDAEPARMAGRRVACEVFDPLLERHLVIRIQPLACPLPERADADDELHSVVIIDDVSDLKQAEAGMRRHNEDLRMQVAKEVARRELSEEIQVRLLTILEKTTDYVAMADASGTLLYLNPAGRSMLGLGPNDDISQRKLCDDADAEAREVIREVVLPAAIRDGVWAGESRMRDRSGRELHTSQVIIAHPGPGGQVECFSTILRDISARVQAEQELFASREELLRLSGLLVSIQEDERRRIALDLHDGLGQSLSLIKLTLENALRQASGGATEAALASLGELVPRLKEALHEVRRVSTDLHPAILDDLGILPTLSWFFREFGAACSQVVIEKQVSIDEQDVPPALRITLYRIIQEAFSNIAKHASAERVRVSLYRADGGLHLEIQDNGHGFDPSNATPHEGECRGLGLISMRERARLSGGRYELESSPGFGTRIHAAWPVG